ncbi:hypothetical protein Taro_055010 [Colocasia esculenta]|uniref:Uncharacterized protein n=1 Tax=Colocasia esculenta TaxID=4460 RepID=A0A843XS25_COLES|nr:hypothetical protein [Colocasia esculenta]
MQYLILQLHTPAPAQVKGYVIACQGTFFSKVRATVKAQIFFVSMDEFSGDPTDDGDPFRFLLLLFLIPRRLRPPLPLLHQDPLERQALLQQGVVVRRPHRPPPQDRAEAYCKERIL